MDPYTSRVILPATLGIVGVIPSGCPGGLVGYALPLHTDLAGRSLETVGVRRGNIEGASLESANLSGSNLWGANLLGADLRRCDLRYAMLRDADLAGANLLGANLRGAVLARASLRGANLEGADLSLADVSETDLRWVRMNDRTAMPEGWEDVVAHGPELRATLPSTIRDRVSAEEWLRAEKDQQECQMTT